MAEHPQTLTELKAEVDKIAQTFGHNISWRRDRLGLIFHGKCKNCRERVEVFPKAFDEIPDTKPMDEEGHLIRRSKEQFLTGVDYHHATGGILFMRCRAFS